MARVLVAAMSAFSSAWNAPYKRVRALLTAIQELGHEPVHLDLAPSGLAGISRYEFGSTMVVAYPMTPAAARGGGYNPLFVRHCLKAMSRTANEYGPDVIIASSPPVAVLLGALEFKRRHQGVHVHLDFRDPYNSTTATLPVPAAARLPFSLLLSHYDRQVKRSLHLVDTTSHAFEPNWNPLYGHTSPNAPDYLWENGVDLNEVGVMRNVTRQANRVVYVGGLTDYYHPEWLLPALQHLPHVEYVIVGSGPGETRILDHPAYASVASQVTLTGRVPSPEALRILASASVAVHAPHPTQDFALSTKVLEYVASGVPVLSFTSPSSPVTDLLSRWGTGMTCAPDDGHVIAEKIHALLDRGPYVPGTQCPGLEAFDRVANARRFSKWLLEDTGVGKVRRDPG